MIVEDKDFDLGLLCDKFTEYGDYTKDVIIKELEQARDNTDFLCLLTINDGVVDGFIIGYRYRDSLWLSQVWRERGKDIKTSRLMVEKTKEWARDRGMTSLTAETTRNKMRAMKRYGFYEYSLNMKVTL